MLFRSPSVSYKIVMNDESEVIISNPGELPDLTYVNHIEEPWVKVEILVPKDKVGSIMTLCQENRGVHKNLQYIDQSRSIITFEMPLASIVVDFYDQLKSVSSGYASMNYEYLDYRREDLVKLDIMVAGETVDALSIMLHRSEAFYRGSAVVKKLKTLIPKAQFEIALQASIGSKIIARETISAMRKDVTAKLYGGDRTRKDKLLKKQKAGKKRMKMMGRVAMPQEAFMSILKKDA